MGGGERAFAGENFKNITGRTQFSTTKNKKKNSRLGWGEEEKWRTGERWRAHKENKLFFFFLSPLLKKKEYFFLPLLKLTGFWRTSIK